MASPCPAGAFISAAGACVCPVGQYLVNSTCLTYQNGPSAETSVSQFIPSLPVAPSWTNSHAQRISVEITSIVVGVWMLFCLCLRFVPLEGPWFRLRYNITRCDVLFSRHHWYDEQKCQVKRRTELGGAMSLASIICFTGLIIGTIWDIETQKQYTVESVMIPSNGEVRAFQNDLHFNLTGYGSLRCSMLEQPTVTTGLTAEGTRTLPAFAVGDSYTCTDNPDGVTLRVLCPNFTGARENFLISSQFNDLAGTQAYALGWAYNVCTVDRSGNYRSCVTGQIAGASNGTSASAATLRGPLASVLSFRFFPRNFQQVKPDVLLLESAFRQYTPGTFATTDAELQTLLANSTGVRVSVLLDIASSFIVITSLQSTIGWLVIVARVGGLFAISYWLFYLIMMQCEKRIKKLRYDDKVINTKERKRIARHRWKKVRIFVQYAQFSTRRPARKPDQVIVEVKEAPAVSPRTSPRDADLAQRVLFPDSLNRTLSRISDRRSEERAGNSLDESEAPADRPYVPKAVVSDLGRPFVKYDVDKKGPSDKPALKRTASLPGGGMRRARNAAPPSDFHLAQHIPRESDENLPQDFDPLRDYLLESQHSGEEPARLRGGAPSPSESPPHPNDSERRGQRSTDLSENGVERSTGLSEMVGQRSTALSEMVGQRSTALSEIGGQRSPGLSGIGGQISTAFSPPSREISRFGRGARSLGEMAPHAELSSDSSPGDTCSFSGLPRHHDSAGGFPSSTRIHVSPPPCSLTPTPGSSRPRDDVSNNSGNDVFIDALSDFRSDVGGEIGRGFHFKKRPKPLDVPRSHSEVSFAQSEPNSASTTTSDRAHHRRHSSAGSGVALLTNIGRGLSRVIPGNLHFPGLGNQADTPKPSAEEVYERLMIKKRKKLGYREKWKQKGMVVRRLKRPSWLGHDVPLPAVPKAPEEEDDPDNSEETEPDIFAMYNHLQDLYDYNVRLQEDFLLAQSMLEHVVQRFRPHSDL